MNKTVGVLGAIIGDLNGSKYEFHNKRNKDIELFQEDMRITDDSILTVATMATFNETYSSEVDINDLEWQKSFKEKLIHNLVKYGRNYPNAGYGGRFRMWLQGFNHYQPYRSYGNGAAMRISPVAWIAKSEDEVKLLSRLVTEITHDHPEGIKGAEATSIAIFMARSGATKEQIKQRIIKDYYPEIIAFDYEILRKTYRFSEKCQDSVPQAIYCFLISKSFEDCIKTTISIGGDCDTTSAISCAIAGAYYGITEQLENKTKPFLTKELEEVVQKFMLLTTKGGN